MSDLRRLALTSLSENKEILFPITPFVTYKESMTISSQDLFVFGEIDSGTTSKLDVWSAESFFPDINNNYDFDLSKAKYHPNFYIIALSRWMKEQQVLRFQYYSDALILNDYYCKITGFTHGEKNGSKNVYYTLDFREYKELKVDSTNIVDNTSSIQRYGSDTYYVGEGDTLVTIAAKIYGDSTKWSYLMSKNNLKNPMDITLGQGLKL